MQTLRKNTKHCSVGEYEFDVAINREIMRKGFKKCPTLWRMTAQAQQNKADFSDVDKFLDLLDEAEKVNEELPIYVATVLPDMLELAGEKLDSAEIIKYCIKNQVDDQFYAKIYEFTLMGFTDGKSVKNPKVTVSLT